jgi:hypothetical protein
MAAAACWLPPPKAPAILLRLLPLLAVPCRFACLGRLG